MVNITNNCYATVQEYQILENRLKGYPCLVKDKEIESSHLLYASEKCQTNVKPTTNEIQVQTHNGFSKIYCFGHNITVKGIEERCSSYVFEIPAVEQFTIGDMVHRSTHVNRVSVNTIEVEVNRRLAKQIRLDNVYIRSNISELDRSLNMAGRLKASLSKKLDLINAPLSWDIAGTIKGGFNSIAGWIETSVTYLTFAFAALVLAALAPAVHIVGSLLRLTRGTLYRVYRLSSPKDNDLIKLYKRNT